VGPLAYLLKNRFYLGEVAYRGELHRGEHEPILDRDLFAAVQTKLAANAVERRVRLKGSTRSSRTIMLRPQKKRRSEFLWKPRSPMPRASGS